MGTWSYSELYRFTNLNINNSRGHQFSDLFNLKFITNQYINIEIEIILY